MSSLPSPAIAASLSFVFPGLGQIYAGARGRGALLGLPWLVMLLGLLFLVLTNRMLELVSHSETMVATLVFLLAVFFYHVAAVVDAYGVARRVREWNGGYTPNYSVGVVVLLVALLALPYTVAEVYGIQANNALDVIARGDNTRDNPFIPQPDFDDETPEPGEGTPGPSPTTTASPTSPSTPQSPTPAGSPASPTPVPPDFGPIDAPWAADGRLDLLLVGADTGEARSSTRTDTMILLSVEIETGHAAMFGFPRNMINVPLPEESRGAYPGGVFPDLLNALWRRAAEQPELFPGSEGIGRECQHDFACERGWRAISGAIQNLAGVPLDGIIAVDLNGFANLVDAVGGIWINIPAPLVEERYRTQDRELISLNFERGCQRLDGTLALAYARSREQDSDYQRMRRQQLVLRSIRRQLDPLAMLPRVPELLNIARDNLFTTIDRDDIPKMAEVAARVDADRIHQVRFQQPALRHVTSESVRRIRERVREIFDQPLPEPSPTPRDPEERCPPR